MTSTSVGAGARAGQTLSGAAGTAGTQALRAAGMQLLAIAGNQAVKVVVDQAVDRVDKVADRLDAVAAGDGRRRGAAPSGTRRQRQDDAGGQPAERPVRVRVGAAFGLVVDQALRILRLVQRLAQQLAAALARLVRRADKDSSDRTAGRPQYVDRAESNHGAPEDEPADGRGADDAGPGANEAQPPPTSPRARPRPSGQPASRQRQAAPRPSARTREHD